MTPARVGFLVGFAATAGWVIPCALSVVRDVEAMEFLLPRLGVRYH